MTNVYINKYLSTNIYLIFISILPGCTVFDEYIRPGTTETVYGNQCHCPHTLAHIVNNVNRMTAVCTMTLCRLSRLKEISHGIIYCFVIL